MKWILLCCLSIFTFLIADASKYHVLLPDGKPAKNAKVYLYLSQIKKLVEFNTDEEGSFYFEKFNVGSQFCIIDAPDCAIGIWMFFGPKAPLKLAPSFTYQGKIVDEKGNPASNATLSLRRLGINTYSPISLPEAIYEKIPGLTAVSDEQGFFTLRGAMLQNYDFLLKAELIGIVKRNNKTYKGLQQVFLNSSEIIEKRPEFQKIDPGEVIVIKLTTQIRGKILDGVTNKPLENATALLYDERGEHKIITQKDGRFEFNDIAASNKRSLYIKHEMLKRIPLIVWEKEVGKSQEVEELTILVFPAIRVSGKALDQTNQKPALVPLTLSFICEHEINPNWFQRMAMGWGNTGEEAKVKSDGSFGMWMPASKLVLKIAGPYYHQRKPYEKEFDFTFPATGKNGLELLLPRKPGILFKMEPEDPADLKELEKWNKLVISVGDAKSSSYGYAEKGQFWFYDVEKWGDKVKVHMERRSKVKKVLLDWTEFEAKEENWPVSIPIPKE